MIGRFYGKLDIQALGGAGFASQRTTAEDGFGNPLFNFRVK